MHRTDARSAGSAAEIGPRVPQSVPAAADSGKASSAAAADYERHTLHLRLNVHELFMQQNRPAHYLAAPSYNRLDVVVRCLAIEHCLGKNDYGLRLYCKMQVRRTGCQNASVFVSRLCALINSCLHEGFREDSEIELDANLQLMDGSHRLALAMYLGADTLPVKIRPRTTNTSYALPWFLSNGFTLSEVQCILDRYHELEARGLECISCILWPPVHAYFDEITTMLRLLYDVRHVQDREYRGETFARLLRGIYACDDIEEWKICRKLQGMTGYSPRVRCMELYLPMPWFRLKAQNHSTISSCGERVKALIRNAYKARVPGYFHDIIVHTGDNYSQSRFISALLEPGLSLREYFARISAFCYMVIKHDAPYVSPDFPDTFPFGKDLDLLCSSWDLEPLIECTTAYLHQTCSARLKIRCISAAFGRQIRVEGSWGGGSWSLYTSLTSARSWRGLCPALRKRPWGGGRPATASLCQHPRMSLSSGHVRRLPIPTRPGMQHTSGNMLMPGRPRLQGRHWNPVCGSACLRISGTECKLQVQSVPVLDFKCIQHELWDCDHIFPP